MKSAVADFSSSIELLFVRGGRGWYFMHKLKGLDTNENGSNEDDNILWVSSAGDHWDMTTEVCCCCCYLVEVLRARQRHSIRRRWRLKDKKGFEKKGYKLQIVELSNVCGNTRGFTWNSMISCCLRYRRKRKITIDSFQVYPCDIWSRIKLIGRVLSFTSCQQHSSHARV